MAYKIVFTTCMDLSSLFHFSNFQTISDKNLCQSEKCVQFTPPCPPFNVGVAEMISRACKVLHYHQHRMGGRVCVFSANSAFGKDILSLIV